MPVPVLNSRTRCEYMLPAQDAMRHVSPAARTFGADDNTMTQWCFQLRCVLCTLAGAASSWGPQQMVHVSKWSPWFDPGSWQDAVRCHWRTSFRMGWGA